jgi:hypothetical protein
MTYQFGNVRTQADNKEIIYLKFIFIYFEKLKDQHFYLDASLVGLCGSVRRDLLTWFRRSQDCQIQNISIQVYYSVFIMKILALRTMKN